MANQTTTLSTYNIYTITYVEGGLYASFFQIGNKYKQYSTNTIAISGTNYYMFRNEDQTYNIIYTLTNTVSSNDVDFYIRTGSDNNTMTNVGHGKIGSNTDMAYSFATELEAKTIGESTEALNDANEFVTKAQAEFLGCDVTAAYASDQFVQYRHLTKHVVPPQVIMHNIATAPSTQTSEIDTGNLDLQYPLQAAEGATITVNLIPKSGRSIISTAVYAEKLVSGQQILTTYISANHLAQFLMPDEDVYINATTQAIKYKVFLSNDPYNSTYYKGNLAITTSNNHYVLNQTIADETNTASFWAASSESIRINCTPGTFYGSHNIPLIDRYYNTFKGWGVYKCDSYGNIYEGQDGPIITYLYPTSTDEAIKNSATFTMPEYNVIVKPIYGGAAFNVSTYGDDYVTLTAKNSNNVEGTHITADCGTTVSLHATSNTIGRTVDWTTLQKNPSDLPLFASHTFIMIPQDVSLSVASKYTPDVAVTLNVKDSSANTAMSTVYYDIKSPQELPYYTLRGTTYTARIKYKSVNYTETDGTLTYRGDRYDFANATLTGGTFDSTTDSLVYNETNRELEISYVVKANDPTNLSLTVNIPECARHNVLLNYPKDPNGDLAGTCISKFWYSTNDGISGEMIPPYTFVYNTAHTAVIGLLTWVFAHTKIATTYELGLGCFSFDYWDFIGRGTTAYDDDILVLEITSYQSITPIMAYDFYNEGLRNMSYSKLAVLSIYHTAAERAIAEGLANTMIPNTDSLGYISDSRYTQLTNVNSEKTGNEYSVPRIANVHPLGDALLINDLNYASYAHVLATDSYKLQGLFVVEEYGIPELTFIAFNGTDSAHGNLCTYTFCLAELISADPSNRHNKIEYTAPKGQKLTIQFTSDRLSSGFNTELNMRYFLFVTFDLTNIDPINHPGSLATYMGFQFNTSANLPARYLINYEYSNYSEIDTPITESNNDNYYNYYGAHQIATNITAYNSLDMHLYTGSPTTGMVETNSLSSALSTSAMTDVFGSTYYANEDLLHFLLNIYMPDTVDPNINIHVGETPYISSAASPDFDPASEADTDFKSFINNHEGHKGFLLKFNNFTADTAKKKEYFPLYLTITSPFEEWKDADVSATVNYWQNIFNGTNPYLILKEGAGFTMEDMFSNFGDYAKNSGINDYMYNEGHSIGARQNTALTDPTALFIWMLPLSDPNLVSQYNYDINSTEIKDRVLDVYIYDNHTYVIFDIDNIKHKGTSVYRFSNTAGNTYISPLYISLTYKGYNYSFAIQDIASNINMTPTYMSRSRINYHLNMSTQFEPIVNSSTIPEYVFCHRKAANM